MAALTDIIQTRHGPMVALRNDLIIGRCLEVYGEYSPREWNVLAQLAKPGMTVLEAGANIGSLTVPLARRCAPGRLIAFEPMPEVFEALRRNVELNALENVELRRQACGEVQGLAKLPAADFDRVGNFGAFQLLDPAADGENVEVVKIDDLGLTELGLIKLDVEGFEAQVLRGAAETLRRCRPLVYTENAMREHQAEQIEALDQLGYRLFWHLPPLVEPDNFRGERRNIFGQHLVSVNMVGIPKESPRPCDLPPIDPSNWTPPLS